MTPKGQTAEVRVTNQCGEQVQTFGFGPGIPSARAEHLARQGTRLLPRFMYAHKTRHS